MLVCKDHARHTESDLICFTFRLFIRCIIFFKRLKDALGYMNVIKYIPKSKCVC